MFILVITSVSYVITWYLSSIQSPVEAWYTFIDPGRMTGSVNSQRSTFWELVNNNDHKGHASLQDGHKLLWDIALLFMPLKRVLIDRLIDWWCISIAVLWICSYFIYDGMLTMSRDHVITMHATKMIHESTSISTETCNRPTSDSDRLHSCNRMAMVGRIRT